MGLSTSWVDLDGTREALHGSLQILHHDEDHAHLVVDVLRVWRNAGIKECPYHQTDRLDSCNVLLGNAYIIKRSKLHSYNVLLGNLKDKI